MGLDRGAEDEVGHEQVPERRGDRGDDEEQERLAEPLDLPERRVVLRRCSGLVHAGP